MIAEKRHFAALMQRACVCGLLLVALAILGGCAGRHRGAPKRVPFRRVKPAVAFEMLHDNEDDLLILDLRESVEYFGPLGHLHDARNVPLAELSVRLGELAGYRNHTFLVYCRNDDCGPTGLAILVSSGFDRAVLIDGGIESWVEAGFGTVDVRPPEARRAPPPLAPAAPPARPFEEASPAPPPGAPAPPVPPVRLAAYMRLADGSLFLAPRHPERGLFIAGEILEGHFVPAGRIEGEGTFCSDLEGTSSKRTPPAPGWLELTDGSFHQEQEGRAPILPYVRGCQGRDGAFRPTDRTVERRDS